MAQDWIKVCKETIDKPEIEHISSMMDCSHEEAFGYWFRLYSYADTATADGFIPYVNLRGLARSAHVPEKVCEALASPLVGWIIVTTGDNAGVKFTNWDRHNGESAKKRAMTCNRMQKYRAKLRISRRA